MIYESVKKYPHIEEGVEVKNTLINGLLYYHLRCNRCHEEYNTSYLVEGKFRKDIKKLKDGFILSHKNCPGR